MRIRLSSLWVALLLFASGQGALAQGQAGETVPLEEDFLLFLDEWVDETDGWIAPSELEDLQLDPNDSGQAEQPLEDNHE